MQLATATSGALICANQKQFFLLNLSILTKRAKVKNRKKENYFFAIFCRNKKMSLKTGRSRLHDYKFRTKKV